MQVAIYLQSSSNSEIRQPDHGVREHQWHSCSGESGSVGSGQRESMDVVSGLVEMLWQPLTELAGSQQRLVATVAQMTTVTAEGHDVMILHMNHGSGLANSLAHQHGRSVRTSVKALNAYLAMEEIMDHRECGTPRQLRRAHHQLLASCVCPVGRRRYKRGGSAARQLARCPLITMTTFPESARRGLVSRCLRTSDINSSAQCSSTFQPVAQGRAAILVTYDFNTTRSTTINLLPQWWRPSGDVGKGVAADETPHVLVLQMSRDIVEVIQPVVVERIRGRVADQMVDFPVPPVMEEIMAVVQGEEKLVPQERVQQRTVEHAPVPQILKR